MQGVAAPIYLAVENNTLRLALVYVIESLGLTTTIHQDQARQVVVDLASLPCCREPVDALVVDPLPIPCQRAVAAVARGDARSAITSDDPESLRGALEAQRNGVVSIPYEVVSRANSAPVLTPRLVETLRLVVAGHSNDVIAQRLHQSQSTVKRDITALFRHFQSADRNTLARTARAAGFVA